VAGGQQATFGQGTLTASSPESEALTGSEATGGTTAPASSRFVRVHSRKVGGGSAANVLTGQAFAASIGLCTPAPTKTPTSQVATLLGGSTVARRDVPLTGAAVSGVQGTFGVSGSPFPLSVHVTKRYLVTSSGMPFLIHGDTAWAIVGQLTNAEIDTYLDDRQAKGFNAVLFSAPEAYYTSQSPTYTNVDGVAPFSPATSFTNPVNAYWNRVDYLVNGAKSRGMVCIINPAYVGFNGGVDGWWSNGLSSVSNANLQAYGVFLATRYQQGNVIWSMGGDWAMDTSTNRDKQWNIVTGMRTVRTTDLITAHGQSGDEAWSFWNGYAGFNLNWTYAYETDGDYAYAEGANAYSRAGPVPHVFFEGKYEGSTSATLAMMRRQSYGSILAGACGQVYGNNPVWHFESPNWIESYSGTWETNMDSTGATHQTYVKALFDAYQWQKLVPQTGTTLVSSSLGTGAPRVNPALASDGTFAMVYVPTSQTVSVVMTALTPTSVRIRLYDPTNGAYSTVGTFANTGTRAIPTGGERVIVLDADEGAAEGDILSDDRSIEWSLAGVEGGITHRTSIHSTVVAGSTVAQINTAITNCSNAGGGVVQLQAGLYTLSSSIIMKSNVTLRGAGVSTELRFTGTGGTTFQYNGAHPPVYFGLSSVTPTFPGPQLTGYPVSQRRTCTSARAAFGDTVTAGSYPKDATWLRLSSAPTGLTAGMEIQLWQTDEDPGAASGTPLSGNGVAAMPRTGFFVSSKRGTSSNANGVVWQGSGVGGQAMRQNCRVVSVSGSDVQVWPPLLYPTGSFKTGLTPTIGWQTTRITGAGIEDCRINCNFGSGTNGLYSVVQFWFAANCWITRCLIQPRTGQVGGSNTYGAVHFFDSRNCTMKSNWVDTMRGGAQGTTTSYGCPVVTGTYHLIENNIFKHVESPLLVHGAALGCVYSYNYEINNPNPVVTSGTQNADEGGSQCHETGISFCLFEANNTKKMFNDIFHGVSNFTTNHRVYYFGTEVGFDLQAYHRYQNVIGCVIGASTRYQTTSSDGTLFDRWSGSAFRLGYNGQGATTNPNFNGLSDPPHNFGVAHDTQVSATLMRWGNYTAAEGSARFLSSEVPSTETHFPNAVPSTNTLPPSLYLSATPSWFTVSGVGTVAFPPIGPDVTGGTSVGGRVHKLPAQLVYEAAGGVATSFNPSLYG
jgi:hypothetical protein